MKYYRLTVATGYGNAATLLQTKTTRPCSQVNRFFHRASFVFFQPRAKLVSYCNLFHATDLKFMSELDGDHKYMPLVCHDTHIHKSNCLV